MRRVTLLSSCLFIACGTFSKTPTGDTASYTLSEPEEVAKAEAPSKKHEEVRLSEARAPSAPSAPSSGPVADLREPDDAPLSFDAPPPPPPAIAGGKSGSVAHRPPVRTSTPRKKPAEVKRAPRRRAPPSSPGVKAGAADDNLQFGAFLEFLRKHNHHGVHRDVSDRVIVEVKDEKGLPINGATVELTDGRRVVQKRTTYADGRALLFPSEVHGVHRQDLRVRMRHGGMKRSVTLADDRSHKILFSLLTKRKELDRVPLDIAFVLDTTGSMGDEIARLKQTIETIHFQTSHLSPRPDVRFGMVLYRDRGDDYVTRAVDFTRDLSTFERSLATVSAGGGNDYPEDVQSGLRSALHELKWREGGVKLAFLIGDAPPHLDYGQEFTYQHAADEAARRGIKIATIGASGLSELGELVWRQVAQRTMSPFVFLTYGETGDSGGGSPALVSHHVGSNWVAENLDAIVIRMVKVELAHLSPRGAPVREDFFSAKSADEVPKDMILEDLFAKSVKQLVDYSVERIEDRTPTVVLPVSAQKKLKGADKLERRLMLGLSRKGQFQLLEREDRGELLGRLAEQLSDKYDADRVTEVGKLVPAKLAVLSKLETGDEGQMEMLVKLVRLETGEVLSLSLLKIDEALVL